MVDELHGDTAIVTGGASGIGRSIALKLAERGADIVVADIRKEPKENGSSTVEIVQSKWGRRASYVECDISYKNDIKTVIKAADEFGGVDIMVNNAGIFFMEDFLETTEEEFDRIMSINAKGVYFGCQLAANAMIDKGKDGRIINISSINGLVANGEYPVYCMSKGAVNLLTFALADKLGPKGIRVNAIAPGSIKTLIREDNETIDDKDPSELTVDEREIPGIPLGRRGEPDDIAKAAVFLSSDKSEYVNGEIIKVDGGWTSYIRS